MPTTRRRRRQPAHEALEPSMREQFLSGDWPTICAAGDASGDKLAQVLLRVLHHRQLWRAHRDELTNEWVERYPGTRPAGFWEYDAREPRYWVLDDGTAIAPNVPATWIAWRELRGIVLEDVTGACAVTVESQASYLARLRLLPARNGASSPGARSRRSP